VVDEKVNKAFPQFAIGTELSEKFIKEQTTDNQEFANQINRRTEFKVLRTDYIPKK
jgi:peptidoglycan-associated lipoprotein